ncbi:Fungal Zn(2)-Cys(6) binuclear cluster domain-containing protein [Penicillium ucsense]|uniref:Fungal Zn(2)-Cys(6) binuclear cluster domain-containing protein n=1 Tax=Penicillium ucsense TaxID=2839758 RepID=A0A8J8WLV4_9EURO|nr:Fungal Zn(2)-Cys(6) binuclear cluster domain-containing protein [Penicillium ucsense]KAF7739361.1 Fungal Zn(2)-Cys(6) binuclear cluster domain-containing protein [Penicillium ucsense]
MSGKRPATLSSKVTGESASGLNETSTSRATEPHSAPATPQRPSIQDRTTTWGATSSTRPSNSTPLLSASQKRPNAATNAKVAIPRQPPNSYAPRYNRRVPRACESCRQRKTKCSGDTPICRQCRELRVNCHYPVGWREKMKKDVDKLNAEIQDYENFVNALRSTAEPRTADWIKNLLDKFGLKGDQPFESTPSRLSTPQNEMDADERSPLSSIGSLEAIDRVEEDLNRTEHTRATGFMGKSSEISWMQRVQREAEQRARGYTGIVESNPEKSGDTRDGFALHALNYHLDDLDISVPEPVERYDVPPRHLADRLFDDYLDTVHPFFPIISKPLFRAQYQTFFDSFRRPSAPRPGDKWLAILNTIFAIAAKHAHLVDAPWRGAVDDHLVYMTRARLLSLNSEVLFSHPDLQQVQVESLVAFYLLASDQINRAWRISALAVRSAITLGINLKNNSSVTPNISKEARYRVWWCLYSFEHMLGIMTGRAIYTLDGGYATPLPLPFEEEQLQEDPTAIELLNSPTLRDELVNNVMASAVIRQASGREDMQKNRSRDQSWLKKMPSNFGLCYLYHCDLTIITQEIVNKVYSTNCVNLSWSEIEARLDELRARIDAWQTSLPLVLDFTNEEGDDTPDQLRCKLMLAFHYYSARITLGRPCLCRRDARQQNSQQTFSHMMALITIDSACRLLGLLPDQPDVLQLFRICPWWAVLRYLMQATTVLLLELSFGSVHVPEDEDRFVNLAKKSIRWFHAMSDRSIGSRRAWKLCDSTFRKLASGMKYATDDLPVQPRSPPRFSAEQFPPHMSSSSFHPHDPHPHHQQHHDGPPLNPNDYFTLRPEDMNPFLPRPATAQQAEGDVWTSYFNLPTPDMVWPPAGAGEITEDSYFPYDPLSEEFIRSFFPSSDEENRGTR